jgi:alginate O-acetyltransferase complex protein AlgJ
MVTPNSTSSPLQSREQVALMEVGRTTVSASTARLLLAVFLATIAVVPAVDVVITAQVTAGGTASVWSHLAWLPDQVGDRVRRVDARGAWPRIVAGNRAVLAGLRAFDDAFDEGSVIGRAVRAPVQLAMSTWLGVGNERVYRGRDGWLFYRPDVEYVTGPGFLDPAAMIRRQLAAAEWTAPPQTDPRRAIARFHRDLTVRGITLVVVPTPVKPTLHPEKLAARSGNGAEPVQNPSYDALVRDLRREGVLVFDPVVALVEARGGGPVYLATDTHWRPEAMELVAEHLAAFIEAHAALPRLAPPGYRTEPVEVRRSGDLAQMLDLPSDQKSYPAETVWLRRVLDADGSPWRPSRHSDVLILGDSFANIYSLGSMGWGEAAGLVEHVSLALQRPIDRIVRNDEGAFATRVLLGQDVDRLARARVVVYQFATRELAFGDWKIVNLSASGGQ